LELRHITEFGCAYRCEVLRMGEQHGPLVANPFVELNRALRRLRSEIRRDRAQPKRHSTLMLTCRHSSSCDSRLLYIDIYIDHLSPKVSPRNSEFSRNRASAKHRSTNFMDEARRILVFAADLSSGVRHLAMASGLPYPGGRSYDNDILEFASYLAPHLEH